MRNSTLSRAIILFILCCIYKGHLLFNSTNRHPRYLPTPSAAKKDKELLFVISITSGSTEAHSQLRHAARNTWLLPCIASSRCNYQFFVDVAVPTDDIRNEQRLFDDLQVRTFCRLMDRHPHFINYGNALPIVYVNSSSGSSKTHFAHWNETRDRDYPGRRFYKIDWKVCFLRFWSGSDALDKPSDNHQSANTATAALFHVFVEDDSFACTENLLFQLGRLEPHYLLRPSDNPTKPNNASGSGLSQDDDHGAYLDGGPRLLPGQRTRGLPFRTGTLLYDGFDDSSTIMTHHVSAAFVQHYRSYEPVSSSQPSSSTAGHGSTPGVEEWSCPRVTPVGQDQPSSVWLSWGNSWRQSMCDWRAVLLNTSLSTSLAYNSSARSGTASRGLPINVPSLHCLSTNTLVLRTFGFVGIDQKVRISRAALLFTDCNLLMLFLPSPPNVNILPTIQIVTRNSYNSTLVPELYGPQGIHSLAHSSPDAHRGTAFHKHVCQPALPLALHHPKAAQALGVNKNESSTNPSSLLRHTCEALLLVDKVKAPADIFALWNVATSNDYLDYSEVFLHDKHFGWYKMLNNMERGAPVSQVKRSVIERALLESVWSSYRDESLLDSFQV